ncbi:MAG: QueT transporter family protein [Clostridia bacterium]|nr:QueT transporter family protein [Clostridia bacterium]
MKKTPLKLTRGALIAASYVVVTLLTASFAYKDIQFRVAEILMLLCFYKKDYILPLSLGCAFANLFSPMALMDITFGTLATVFAAIFMWKCKNIYIAALFPVLFNAVIVGAELRIMFDMPFLLSALSVGAGELAVMVAGVILFKTVLEKRDVFQKVFEPEKFTKSY